MHPSRFAFAPVLATALLLPAVSHAQARATASDTGVYMRRALRVLRTTPLVDGHNDLAWRIREDSLHPMDVAAYDLSHKTAGMTDIPRLRAGHVGAQFWSVYTPGEANDPAYRSAGPVTSTPGYARVQLEEIDIARRFIAAHPRDLQLALSEADVRDAFRHGRIASLLGMEGGHAIENSPGLLRDYYALGVRYMTLTHNVTLSWADAALDSATHGGLTDLGRDVVREMNRLGMIVDLAHVSPGTMSDVLDVTSAPVIFSHSGARALVDYPRNVPDSILARVPKNGGVVMVPFVPSFVSPAVLAWDDSLGAAARRARAQSAGDTTAARTVIDQWKAAHPEPRATIADVANHIEHVRDVAGIDHVGIGSDFDGIDSTPLGLEDVSKFPALFAELARRGWSDADLRKLAGENVLRVMRDVERVAKKTGTAEWPHAK